MYIYIYDFKQTSNNTHRKTDSQGRLNNIKGLTNRKTLIAFLCEWKIVLIYAFIFQEPRLGFTVGLLTFMQDIRILQKLLHL